MLSRTADHLYWMGRYLERAEHLARLLDAHHRQSLLPRLGAWTVVRIGTALLQVSTPRIPCSTFGRWLGEDQWVKRFKDAGRWGSYLRVLEAGDLACCDDIVPSDSVFPPWPLSSSPVGAPCEPAGAFGSRSRSVCWPFFPCPSRAANHIRTFTTNHER